jgi:hypothetical protein
LGAREAHVRGKGARGAIRSSIRRLSANPLKTASPLSPMAQFIARGVRGPPLSPHRPVGRAVCASAAAHPCRDRIRPARGAVPKSFHAPGTEAPQRCRSVPWERSLLASAFGDSALRDDCPGPATLGPAIPDRLRWKALASRRKAGGVHSIHHASSSHPSARSRAPRIAGLRFISPRKARFRHLLSNTTCGGFLSIPLVDSNSGYVLDKGREKPGAGGHNYLVGPAIPG